MSKRKYLDEIPVLIFKDGGSTVVNLGIKAAKLVGLDKKYKGKGNTKYKRNIYNLVDPTNAYPKTIKDALTYKAIADQALVADSVPYIRETNEPLANAAWAKRLELPYDDKYLIDNGDGTVRLNPNYEAEIPIDTTYLKNRIAANENLLKYYESIGADSPDRRQAIDYSINYDQQALDSLRHTYKTGEPVVLNEHSNNTRKWIKDGVAKLGISPLSALQNYTIRYNKNKNTIDYFDIYDFNEFEDFVPGTPFTIKGSINLNKKKCGGSIKRRSLASGGKLREPSTKPTLDEYYAQRAAEEQERYYHQGSKQRVKSKDLNIKYVLSPQEIKDKENRINFYYKDLAERYNIPVSEVKDRVKNNTYKGLEQLSYGDSSGFFIFEDLKKKEKELKDGFMLYPASNCIATATDNNPNPGHYVTGNQTFIANPQKYGFKKVSIEDVKPGSLVQNISDGVPTHALIVDNIDSNGNMKFNYSPGKYPDYRTSADYPLLPNSIYYNFVGNEADSARWKNEYEQIYGSNKYKSGGSIYIKPSHRGRLTELKARTGKSEAELYSDGNPAHKKMVVFARNARKWKH